MAARKVSRRVIGGTAITAAAGAGIMLWPGAETQTAFGENVAAPLAQATAVSPQPTSTSPQPTPTSRPLRFYPVAPVFVNYYSLVDGPRTLGQAISPLLQVNGVPAQYFEKARLEDHRASNNTGNPAFDFEYGLLVDEMKAINSPRPIGGERSNVTYATINQQSAENLRVPVPPGFQSGNVATNADGSTFIPFTADLSAAPGHNVPTFFWQYMNDPTLFPGGWLHDIGLPITPLLNAIVDKGRFLGGAAPTPFTNVPIQLQAFQRTILTYDPANPEGFLVERANTGTDYFFVFPNQFPA
ncbi:MAG TPA: hypothetical protein VHQ00_13480 [Chloroflexota bacterium]|nr:hypothetical protein [Chloroflexota bacterium]